MRYLKTCLIVALGFSSAASAGDDPDYFMAVLESLNDSGVVGVARLVVEDGQYLTVQIEATGLEPSVVHPQHIHGLDKPRENSSCPGPEADANGDGIVSVGEGLPWYGPVVLPLAPFNLVDGAGELSYTAMFTIRPESLRPLHKRSIVLHGLSVDGGYVASVPVACGEIFEVE